MPDWNEIVRSNAANVLNAALRVLGNLSDAEDVSQEVFAEAFRKWDVGKGDTEPDHQWAGILRRMAVCRAIDSLRSRKFTKQIASDQVQSSADDPMCNAISRELEERLRIYIGQLPPRESQVFCLMYFEQQSLQQIAAGLEMSRAAVATALSKARSKLEAVFREISTGESNR